MEKELSKDLKRAILQEIKTRLANGETVKGFNVATTMGLAGFKDRDAINVAYAEIRGSGFIKTANPKMVDVSTGEVYDYEIAGITEAGEQYLDSCMGLG